MKLPDKPEIRQFRNMLKQLVTVVDDQALSCGRSNAFQKKDTTFCTAGAAKYSAHCFDFEKGWVLFFFFFFPKLLEIKDANPRISTIEFTQISVMPCFLSFVH